MSERYSLEAGDQEHYSNADNRAAGAMGGVNAAAYMNKDKIVNKIREEENQHRINERLKHESGYAAKMHGREPSKGARIDAELAQDDVVMIEKKTDKEMRKTTEQRHRKQNLGSKITR